MDYLNNRQLILTGNMRKVILTLSLPIMLGNLIQTLYNLADTFWVGRLGTDEIAALGLVFPFIFLMLAFGIGMNVSGTALISQHIGSDNHKAATLIAGQLFTLSAIFSIFVSIAGYVSIPHILSLIGDNVKVQLFATQYLQIMFLGAPTIFLFFVFNAVKHGQGDTVTPMILNASGVVLNIFLSPVFIFTFGLGVQGAALATVFSRGLFMLYAIYTLFSHRNGIKLAMHNLVPNKNLILQILKIGLPASIGTSATAFGFIILNSFVVSFGSATLAAFTIGNRINSLVLMPAMGIGNSLSSIVGQNLGADNKERAKLAFKTALSLSIPFMAVGGFLLFLLAPQSVGAFTNDPEVLLEGVKYARLISLSLPLMGIFQSLLGTFQGSGHTIYGMYLEMGRLWALRIPMIIVFKNITDWGSSSVWYAMVISNAIICTVGMFVYFKGKWLEKVIEQTTNTPLLGADD
ncbi:MAG: MATE family efflux transporter [Alkaliphilus sp.]